MAEVHRENWGQKASLGHPLGPEQRPGFGSQERRGENGQTREAQIKAERAELQVLAQGRDTDQEAWL